MLPRKLRTAKIQSKIIDPQGKARWQAATVARGILRTTAKWLEDKDEVEIDRLDILLLERSKQHLHEAAPIIGWTPFRAQATSLIVATVRTAELRYRLGLSG